jgi:uncharacterized membrane protein
MAKRQLVLAVFPDEPTADNAAVELKESGIAHGDAIGILVLNEHGKLKQHKVGARSVGKGAAIGGVVAVVGTAVLGPAILVGAGVGALHHKHVGMSDDDKARLAEELSSGKAAVGVMAEHEQVAPVTDYLTQAGGQTQAHELSDEALEAAEATETAAV